MKLINVTMLNKNAEGCAECEAHQDNGVAPACPEHIEEMEAALMSQEPDYEPADEYFQNNWGDMLDFQLDSIAESDSWRS